MANIDDLLKKNKARIDSIKKEHPREKRNGPKRPWQENLDRYKDRPSTVTDAHSNAPEAPPVSDNYSPSSDTGSSKTPSPRAIIETSKISEQYRNEADTIPGQKLKSKNRVSEQNRNDTGSKQEHNQPPSTAKIGTQDVSEQKYRHNNGTIPEQNLSSALQISEQSRNDTGTISGPANVSYIETSNTAARVEDDTQEKVSEQKYRNSTGTIKEQNSAGREVKEQSRNKSVTSAGTIAGQIDVYSLPKSEEKILRLLVQICVKTGKTITPKITYEKLSSMCGTPLESCKTLVKRLEKKGYLQRVDMRKGPGSWTVFEVPTSTYQAFLSYESRNQDFGSFFSNDLSIGTNTGTGRGTDIRTVPPSSSSINNNINTTTEEGQPWTQIMIPDFLRRQGFSVVHAQQILSGKENPFSVEELQDFFDNFAIDLESGAVSVQTTPIKFFMGIVRGKRQPYLSVSATKKLENDLDSYFNTVAHAENLLKQRAQAELVGKCMSWLKDLSQVDKNKIVPPTDMVEEGGARQELLLRSHFMEKHKF